MVRLFSNPRAFGWEGRKPVIVVTNPDIFYYALYVAAYNPHDRRNLLEQFLTRFDYVVVDEFHYYSPKQLANFLFFFVIGQEWGYFAGGRRVCLLSATPEDVVQDYLKRAFPEPDSIAWINPANEPEESAAYDTMPTLAPLTLEITPGTLDEFAADGSRREWLAGLLSAGQDGALISNALWRVNEARAALRGQPFEGRVRRLTGAESAASRRDAPLAPLILATPTVDIGYNFSKPDKERQPLDFIVFDTRTRDEFLQRLGRAGRVLGRGQTGESSQAVALVPDRDDALLELKNLDGRIISRQELRRTVREALPPRNDLFAYIHSYAVLEAFRPIYELERTMRPDLKEWVERLFESLREVLAPNGQRWYFGSLMKRMRRHKRIERIVRMGEQGELYTFVDDYLNWHRVAEIAPGQWQRVKQALRTSPSAREQLLLPWLEAEYSKAEALFNFRDSFQGPLAAVYDPHHLLADTEVTFYDALHVARNFEADYLDGPAAFRQATGIEAGDTKVDVYCRLTRRRDPRLWLRLTYREERLRLPREEWERLYTRRPVALQGLRLQAEVPSGGPTPLPPALHKAFDDKYVICLIVPESDEGRLRFLLHGRNLFPRRLVVTLASEGTSHKYLTMVGTAAFVVDAELQGYFWYKKRREEVGPIIC
jgi:CRISPR-associated endonuclease/helicase Cas3